MTTATTKAINDTKREMAHLPQTAENVDRHRYLRGYLHGLQFAREAALKQEAVIPVQDAERESFEAGTCRDIGSRTGGANPPTGAIQEAVIPDDARKALERIRLIIKAGSSDDIPMNELLAIERALTQSPVDAPSPDYVERAKATVASWPEWKRVHYRQVLGFPQVPEQSLTASPAPDLTDDSDNTRGPQ